MQAGVSLGEPVVASGCKIRTSLNSRGSRIPPPALIARIAHRDWAGWMKAAKNRFLFFSANWSQASPWPRSKDCRRIHRTRCRRPGSLQQNPKPTRAQIVAHMSANLCRCGTYQRIVTRLSAPRGRPSPWQRISSRGPWTIPRSPPPGDDRRRGIVICPLCWAVHSPVPQRSPVSGRARRSHPGWASPPMAPSLLRVGTTVGTTIFTRAYEVCQGCCLPESRMLAQGAGCKQWWSLELRMLPENLERWEMAVAASLVIAISTLVITLILTSGSAIGL